MGKNTNEIENDVKMGIDENVEAANEAPSEAPKKEEKKSKKAAKKKIALGDVIFFRGGDVYSNPKTTIAGRARSGFAEVMQIEYGASHMYLIKRITKTGILRPSNVFGWVDESKISKM